MVDMSVSKEFPYRLRKRFLLHYLKVVNCHVENYSEDQNSIQQQIQIWHQGRHRNHAHHIQHRINRGLNNVLQVSYAPPSTNQTSPNSRTLAAVRPNKNLKHAHYFGRPQPKKTILESYS